jgi:hypothetical protein
VAARAAAPHHHARRLQSQLQQLQSLVVPMAEAAKQAGLACAYGVEVTPAQVQSNFAATFKALSELAAALPAVKGSATGGSFTADSDSARMPNIQQQQQQQRHCLTATPPHLSALLAENSQLKAETQALRMELAEARERAPGGGAAATAVSELEAVLPRYKAAAAALQGQVTVMRKELGQVVAQRDGLQAEVSFHMRV